MIWDFAVVGSGFGGAVSALRLVERGYRVVLLEKGPRYAAGDFPESNWDVRRWLWAPRLGLGGPFRMTFLRHVTALTGVGFGGGSLVYANALAPPPDAFFRDPAWAGLSPDWAAELAPHYARARRMLGVTAQPSSTRADRVVGDVARAMGLEDAHRPADVGVYFGEAGRTVADPYFGGEGPRRTGCIECGGCMLGCRHGAKNTLDLNYLWLAERRGLEVRTDHEVTWIRRDPGGDGYRVEALAGTPRPWRRRTRHTLHARRVVLAAGVLGTVPLLLKLRAREDGLPRLSRRVGDAVRTNTEVLMGVVDGRREEPLSRGVAITSVLRTDARSTVEPVRYPDGSGFFRLLMLPHAPGATLAARLGSALRRVARAPLRALRAFLVGDLARHSMVLLYMRTGEGSLALRRGRGGRVRTEVAGGEAPAASLPEATELGERVAEAMDGFLASMATETLLGRPTTAHLLGGCVLADGPERGVVDARHRVFGYPGLYVVDGSALPANPGVNPSLTIAALAERAAAFMADEAAGEAGVPLRTSAPPRSDATVGP